MINVENELDKQLGNLPLEFVVHDVGEYVDAYEYSNSYYNHDTVVCDFKKCNIKIVYRGRVENIALEYYNERDLIRKITQIRDKYEGIVRKDRNRMISYEERETANKELATKMGDMMNQIVTSTTDYNKELQKETVEMYKDSSNKTKEGYEELLKIAKESARLDVKNTFKKENEELLERTEIAEKQVRVLESEHKIELASKIAETKMEYDEKVKELNDKVNRKAVEYYDLKRQNEIAIDELERKHNLEVEDMLREHAEEIKTITEGDSTFTFVAVAGVSIVLNVLLIILLAVL